jgi:hypothetical protein
MADISRLEQQADLLMQNLSGWETSTLERIGKRIKKYGKLSLADVKSINNMAVVKQDMDAITKELAQVTGYNISQIEQMYADLLADQHLENKPLYDYRGKKFVPFAENKQLQTIARAYAKVTAETMVNLSKTKMLGIYTAKDGFIGLKKAYTDVLDKAVIQITSGATDFHTAMRQSIIDLGGSGVRVYYGSGITRRLDTVVRQNLLWGAKQASIKYNDMIGEELGCDGIEVDWHSFPRPSHEFMQGKQFVIGKSRTINGKFFESADEALERLQDYGCLHYKSPIICGISEPRYSEQELKSLNDQNARRYTIGDEEYSGYEVTQMQRRLETAVRNEKTTRDLARASGDNALVKRCNERIKAYQGKYDEISEVTGIPGDKKRMSVARGATPKVEPTKPTFKKAETIEEAQQSAKKFVYRQEYESKRFGKQVYEGTVDFGKMDVEYANTFNETMQRVVDDYGTEPLKSIEMMNFREKRWKGAETAGGAYNPSPQGSMYFNPKVFSNRSALERHLGEVQSATEKVLSMADDVLKRGTSSESLLAQVRAVKESGRLGAQQILDAYQSAEATFVHEIGHMLDYKKFKSMYKEYGFDVSASMLKYGYKISGYAVSGADEYIAESFVMHWFGHDELVDPDLLKIFLGGKIN